jgi:hypothetical protein
VNCAFSIRRVAHPGLKLQVEGYTDSVGSDTFNQTLSENRANSVRAYLTAQGIDPTSVTYLGYGKSNPVASNDTATVDHRIIELPQEPLRVTSHDPHSGFVAYVPVGSIAKGERLVTTGGSGKTITCSICHGQSLTGMGEVPRIAGRSPL